MAYLLVSALAAADSVLIPVQVEPFALEAIPELVQSIRRSIKYTNPTLKIEGFLATMCKHTKLSKEVITYLNDNYGQAFFTARIPDLAEAPISTREQRSLVSMNGRLGKAYEELADELITREQA